MVIVLADPPDSCRRNGGQQRLNNGGLLCNTIVAKDVAFDAVSSLAALRRVMKLTSCILITE
jgi:hypothetical protein